MAKSEDRSADNPVCVLLAICNDVIEDKSTNNKSLIGLYNQVGTPSVPAVQGKMCIVASVANVRGNDIPVKFEIIDPEDTVVFTGGIKISSNDPLLVHDMVVQMFGFPLQKFGPYRLELHAAGQYMLSRTFTVYETAIPGHSGA